MNSVRQATIDGFNSFIEEQKAVEGEARLSLTLFSTAVDARYIAVPLENIPPLGSETNDYVPNGNTALLDAVGKSIMATELWLDQNNDFSGKVVCVILTDGMDNASHVWTKGSDLNDIIASKQNDGWEFMFLGSGGSEWLERTFGGVVDSKRFMGYAHAGGQTLSAYSSVSTGLTATRSTGATFLADNG